MKVYLRPEADVKLFRIPESLPSRSMSCVKVKPENKVIDIESRPRKSNDSQVYKSRLMLGQNSLGVAVVNGNNVFITQVSDSYEFKPNLQRLDVKGGSKGKSVSKEDQTIDVEDDDNVTSVTMRFAASNEEDRKRARENSHVHLLERIQKEQTIDLDYIPETSNRAKDVRDSLGRL